MGHPGSILESKGMRAIIQKKGKKGQNIWKFGQKCIKNENILKKGSLVQVTIPCMKQLEYVLVSPPPLHLKNTTPFFCQAPLPYINKLSKLPLLGNPPSILVFPEHHPKSWIFQWIPKTLKFSILSTILLLKSTWFLS